MKKKEQEYSIQVTYQLPQPIVTPCKGLCDVSSQARSPTHLVPSLPSVIVQAISLKNVGLEVGLSVGLCVVEVKRGVKQISNECFSIYSQRLNVDENTTLLLLTRVRLGVGLSVGLCGEDQYHAEIKHSVCNQYVATQTYISWARSWICTTASIPTRQTTFTVAICISLTVITNIKLCTKWLLLAGVQSQLQTKYDVQDTYFTVITGIAITLSMSLPLGMSIDGGVRSKS